VRRHFDRQQRDVPFFLQDFVDRHEGFRKVSRLSTGSTDAAFAALTVGFCEVPTAILPRLARVILK
jgi:hypothetical protein